MHAADLAMDAAERIKSSGGDTTIDLRSPDGRFGGSVIPKDSMINYKPTNVGTFVEHKKPIL